MHYHLNRALFYHQLLSAIDTEVSKKELISSPVSFKQDSRTAHSTSHQVSTTAPNTKNNQSNPPLAM